MTTIPPRPPGRASSLPNDPRARSAGKEERYGPAFARDAQERLTIVVELPLVIRNGKPAIDLDELVKRLPKADNLVVEDDQLAVKRSSAVEDLPSVGATLSDVVDKVNAMLASEREAGQREA